MRNMPLILLVFSFPLLMCNCSTASGQQYEANSACIINDWKRSPGICKPLRECGAVISNLRTGVQPTLCRVENHKAVVCCPSTPRISEIMCNRYKEVLRQSLNGPISPIPQPEFDIPNEINCDELERPSFIVGSGGRDANNFEYPHMAGLGWGTNSTQLEWKCGGTLISDEFILTAAHCLVSEAGQPSYVLLGDIRRDLFQAHNRQRPGRVVLKIKDCIIHPEYKVPSTYNDIALLRLERKVNLSRAVLPACLTQPQYRLENNLNMTQLGWALLKRHADILQAVYLDRFTSNECSEIYDDNLDKPFRYSNGIQRTQFCAGDRNFKGSDSCEGDSGGPIIVRNETIKCIFHVMGITSFGASICGIQAGVYTNVQSYLDWIEQHVWGDQVV